MELRINIKKMPFILIIALIIIVSFVIAQSSNPINPGHDDDEIWVSASGASGTNLDTWVGHVNTVTNDHEGRIGSLEGSVTNLEDVFWTPVSVPGGTIPLCYVCNSGTSGTPVNSIPIPGVYIPPGTVKEVLVYVWAVRGSQGSSSSTPIHFSIYTKEGSTKYAHKFVVVNYNSVANVFNSDTFWLPVTSDYTVHVDLPSPVDGNFQSGVEFIGYR
jgi:hypothetical protein